MNQLIFWIGLYLVVSVAVGLYAATRVRTERDYILASKGLPIYVTIATVFATWFGSETVLGTSSTFLEEGIAGIIADPFGASLCLILAGLFFARPLYRMGILTLGDFYRLKYGREVEVLASICIIISYLGWVSAQIVALGVIFSVLSGGLISQAAGAGIGALIVLVYTVWGGMWSVALTDFMQMIVIVLGMSIAAFFVAGQVGGVGFVVQQAIQDNQFVFFPEGVSTITIIGFFAALLTMGFGSIPQEDVFQRMMSAKSENTAVRGTVIGGSLYLIIAFLPILLAYSAKLLMPEQVSGWIATDSQLTLPNLILGYTPVFVQVMFFGGLLSAIMSTASGTLLAPSAILSQNLLRQYFQDFTDKKLVQLTRISVLFFFLIVMGFVAYKFYNSEANIFQMVESAYKITLAGVFVPLVLGICYKNTHHVSGLFSIISGVATWILLEITIGEIADPQTWYAAIPPQFYGAFASLIGFFIGESLTFIFKEKNWVKSTIEG